MGKKSYKLYGYMFATLFKFTGGAYKKGPYFLIFFFKDIFLPCRVPTFRGQKVLNYGRHLGISFLHIDGTRSNLKFHGSHIVI